MRDITAFDIETADLHNTRICAIGITIIHDGKITENFTELVNPECEFGVMNMRIHGITPPMVAGCPTFPQIWNKYRSLFTDNIVAAHGAATADFNYLKKTLDAYGIEVPEMSFICTLELAKLVVGDAPNYKLKTLGRYYGISFDNHDAGEDSRTCAELLCRWIEQGVNLEEHVKIYRPPLDSDEKPRKKKPVCRRRIVFDDNGREITDSKNNINNRGNNK